MTGPADSLALKEAVAQAIVAGRVPCAKCGKSFSNSRGLATHKRSCPGSLQPPPPPRPTWSNHYRPDGSPFICNYCGAPWVSFLSLVAHVSRCQKGPHHEKSNRAVSEVLRGRKRRPDEIQAVLEGKRRAKEIRGMNVKVPLGSEEMTVEID